jgi:uncharacterized protein (TIGR02147 family)
MTPIYQETDIRIILQAELVRRCKENPRYSLRAFAGYLRIESSALSKILNGKRSVSPSMFKKLTGLLNIEPKTVARLSAQIVETRGRTTSKAPKKVAVDYQKIAQDHYLIFSDWYYFAILELLAIEDFEPSASWVARSLDLTVAETKAAIERLIRTGFLKIDSSGKWIDAAGSVSNIAAGTNSLTARKLQSQLFKKAVASIDEVAIEDRDHTGMTMSISRGRLPEARRKIEKFRRELCSFLEAGNEKDAVYQLSLALFPLTKIPKKTLRNKT